VPSAAPVSASSALFLAAALQAGEALETHLQDRVGLDPREPELVHQPDLTHVQTQRLVHRIACGLDLLLDFHCLVRPGFFPFFQPLLE